MPAVSMGFPKSAILKLLFIALASVVFSSFHSVAVATDADRDQAVVNSFLNHVDELESIGASQKKEIRDLFAKYANRPQDALTESLLIIYPDYAAGLESSDADNLTESIRLLAPLADSTDSFVAADASFYLARTLMNNQRFEQALPRLQKLTNELRDFTLHHGDAQYFVGVAQAGMLQNADAIKSFFEFIESNPDAAERLRVSAWRQIQQLQAIQDGKLADIHQHMDFSRRRLELIETDEKTQEKQDNIITMLAKLIKDKEKQEAASSSKKSQNTKQQQAQKPSAPQPGQEPGDQPGKSDTGGQSSNPNGEAVKKTYDDSPASPWSRLRDRSRDPANNAIKEKLPARYRDIVEKYYQRANGEDE